MSAEYATGDTWKVGRKNFTWEGNEKTRDRRTEDTGKSGKTIS